VRILWCCCCCLLLLLQRCAVAVNISLFNPNPDGFDEYLDSKETGSVVYVSFESMAALERSKWQKLLGA
jgi:hypothetical protein